MMGSKERGFASIPDDVSLETLVPKADFYRRLEEGLDLSFLRELVPPRTPAGDVHQSTQSSFSSSNWSFSSRA